MAAGGELGWCGGVVGNGIGKKDFSEICFEFVVSNYILCNHSIVGLCNHSTVLWIVFLSPQKI